MWLNKQYALLSQLRLLTRVYDSRSQHMHSLWHVVNKVCRSNVCNSIEKIVMSACHGVLPHNGAITPNSG